MTITSVQLWERIHAAGLASPEDCRKWAAEVSSTSSPDSLHDPNKLAKELIRLGKLTPFQANVLYSNLAIPLAIGSYRITESLESAYGANWFQAIDIGKSKGTRLLCFLLTQQSLANRQIQSWPPSFALGEAHVALSHPCLDRWLHSGTEKSSVFSFCKQLEGRPLSERIAKQSLTWQTSVAMIEQLASAIAKLHSAGLVHGCLSPEAIWCTDDEEFVLRRDAIFPPANPYSSSFNSILARSADSLLAIAAPELTLPATLPSIQSDLYALGCVWYQSLTGHSVWSPNPKWNAQDWAKAHLVSAPPKLEERQLPAPLQRCLAHLLAKNPSARFASASALIKAIESAATQAHEQSESKQSHSVAPIDLVKEAATAYGINEPATDNIASKTSAPTIKSGTPVKPAASPKSSIPARPVLPAESPKEKQANQVEAPASAPSPAAPSPAPAGKTAPSTILPVSSDVTATGEVAEHKVSSGNSVVAPLSVKNEASKPIDPIPTPKLQQERQNPALPPAPKKKKSKKKKKPAWILPAMIVGACLLFGVVVAVLVQDGSKTIPVDPNTNVATTISPNGIPSVDSQDTKSTTANATRTDVGTSKPTNSISEYFTVEPDDGQLLWAPLQTGSSYSLELFPAGVEAVVFLSSKSFHDRGAANGIGKWWNQMQPELMRQLANVPLLNDSRVASVAIGLYPSKNPGLPQAVFRLSWTQPVTIESIVQETNGFKLKMFEPKSNNKNGYWSNEPQANATSIAMEDLQTDTAAMVKRVVIGPTDLLSSLPELNGGPAPLRRQLETLLKSTDSRSDLCIVAAPSFLFGDGRELLSSLPKWQEALRDAIDDSIQAISFSTSVEPRWYLELRMVSSETKDLGKFASSLKSRLMGLPDIFEQGLSAGMELHPYWRALGLRYPQMLRAFTKYLRVGLEDGQVVANAYLPSDAMNNVAIASWMAMHPTTSAVPAGAASKPATTTKPIGKSIEEILDSKISIGFDQESLEAALQLIANEVAESVLAGNAMSMTIDGASFQKEGITRNQSIRDFRQNAVPLRAMLTDLVRRANPVTTVQSPTEKNQKVVWVVIDDPGRPGAKKIELTTRTNAEAKKLTLPKEFVP